MKASSSVRLMVSNAFERSKRALICVLLALTIIWTSYKKRQNLCTREQNANAQYLAVCIRKMTISIVSGKT